MASEAAKAGIGYTVANILVRGIGFLTLPVFSRLLGAYDFGIYNVFIAYDAVLFCIIGFALHSSVKNANWEFPGKIDEYISSLTLLYISNAITLLLLAVVFRRWFSEITGLDLLIILALVLHGFGSAIVALFNARVSLQYSYRKYMAVAALSSFGNIVVSLVLIFTIFNNSRYMGRIFGATAVVFLVGVMLIVLFWRKAQPKVCLQYWIFGMRYSLPIVAHGFSQVALAQIGRLMTNYMVSTIAAGIYGLAANLLTIFAVLADSISTVWSTWFYEIMEGESASNATQVKCLSSDESVKRGCVIRERANQLSKLFALTVIFLLTVAPELIWLLGGDSYIEGTYCAFGIILSGYCIFLYNLICVGEYYKQRTMFIMIGTVIAAVINIALNFWGILTLGYIAAAYMTLIAYICYVIFHWVISKRLMGFSILSLGKTLRLGCLLVIIAVIDVVFLNSIVIRVSVGVATMLLITLSLMRELHGVRGVMRLLGK